MQAGLAIAGKAQYITTLLEVSKGCLIKARPQDQRSRVP